MSMISSQSVPAATRTRLVLHQGQGSEVHLATLHSPIDRGPFKRLLSCPALIDCESTVIPRDDLAHADRNQSSTSVDVS